jgi:putative transcriptional regulator
MMRHHPSQETLLAFAAGSLPEPHRRVVAVHLGLCPACAATSRDIGEIGGALLDTLPPTALEPDALARTLARLDALPVEAAPPAPIPVPTLAALAVGRWRWAGPGISIMPLARRDASNSRLDLIRVAPGTALLEHGHTGFETTLVLQGAFDDGIDRYQVGDFAEADGRQSHQPRALAGDDCICLIATSAHLSPKGLLGRLVRPLLGM